MNSQQYWRQRILYQKKQELESAAEYELAMKARLKDLEREFEKEAMKFIRRYANENNVSLKQAASVLNSVNNHQWSMSLKEFEAKAKAGGYDKVLNSEYYRSRIARLQDLHDQLAKIAEKYSATESIRMRDELVNVFQNTYLQDWYVHDKLEGQITINVNHLNEQQLEDIVRQPWQGGNFSDRIWHNYTEVLPEVLTDTLMRSTVMGYSVSRVVKEFRDKFADVSSKNIHRLVITEMGHAAEQATAKFYEESNIDKYQYLATLESHTCDECAHLDERIFNVKDRVPGKNYPLIHPYCRCTTVPYIEGITGGEDRWYRDSKTGKGSWVKNMSYSEWKKTVTDDKYRKQYDFLRKNYGKHGFPKTFQEFQKAMYNNGIENRALKAYINAREKGTVEPVATFYDYLDAMNRLEEEVVGSKTSNGQIVTDYTQHIIDRIFGVRIDPKGERRIGVSIDEIKEMLKSKETRKRKGFTSFVTDEGYVALKYDGKLITVVPRKRTKK